MKKEHWITIGLLILTLMGGCLKILSASIPMIDIIGIIFLCCLPLITLFKNRIAGSIWSVVLMLYGIRNLILSVGGIIVSLPEKNLWNTGDVLYGYSTFEDYIFHEVCLSLESVCFLAFGLMIIIWLFKKLKSRAIYIPGIILLITSFFTGMWWNISLFSIVYNWFEPMIFAFSAYMLIHEKPEKVQAREITANISNSDKTGFSYLDEYKRNMKK